MTAVLDSSAFLAVLLDEPGKDRVLPYLDDAVMSSVNWSEVVSYMARRQASAAQVGAAAALMAGRILAFGAEEAGLAGRLATVTRDPGLSLGGRWCPAVAILRKATVVTSDRAWSRLDIGIPVEVIR
jgi:PIN domain nuclease of toxin-antitoxin system